jgi:16S rRNA (adenine1518-N6/adenine1519-N6)-dimethyltransferase
MDQFFLTSPERIQTMIDAAGLSADDTVIEVGAGIGSFAVHLPPVKRLDLVELDEELCAVMSARLERADAHIHATDAITYLPAHDGDVIFSNLPYFLTHDLLQVLSQKSFRVAVVCVRQGEDLSSWKEAHHNPRCS